MITNSHNEERGLDITELPTDEYPVLSESALMMTQEAAELSDASAESKGEPVRAASPLAQLEAEVSRLHGKWQSIEPEFKKRETQIVLLNEEIRTRETAIARLIGDLERDAVALEAAEQRLEGKDAEIAELVAERRARDERIAALSQELADAQITHKRTLESLARAEAEAARLNDLLRQEQAATAAVASRNQQLLAQQELLQGKLQDLEIYINGRHDRWSALNAELAAHKHALLEREETVKARDAVIAQDDQERSQLAASIRDLERQCSELAGRRKEREEAYDELQKKLAGHFAEAEQLKTEYANRTKETELAAKNALDTQHRIESLEGGITRRDEDIDALNAKVQQGKLAIGELTTAKTALGNRVDELEKELAERTQQLSKERDAAQKEAARIGAELDTMSAHSIELGRLRGEAVAENHQLTLALTAQQKLVARLETEIRAKQATVDVLERSVERITDLGASLAALDQQMNGGNGKREVEQSAPPSGTFAPTVAADHRIAAAAPAATDLIDVDLQPMDLLLDAEPNGNVVDIGERTQVEAGRKLVVTIGGRAFDYPILKKDITIGRGHDSDIRITSHFISRVHARLSTNGVATIIEDAGSKNGVLVNSKRVLRRVLRDGDVVNLGDDSSLRFVDATH
jgi:chromosome segregation ATPase